MSSSDGPSEFKPTSFAPELPNAPRAKAGRASTKHLSRKLDSTDQRLKDLLNAMLCLGLLQVVTLAAIVIW